MGGASSKLNENDWPKADGKIRSPIHTIDGEEPTSEYKIYYMTKKGVSQREFDITDDDKNLLYTTKAVPGTIACFDVLGHKIGDYLLRVNVDIARRNWVVYRYNEPVFEGQMIDKDATNKLASERFALQADTYKEDLRTTPPLYKRCLITVSWSRYMAVATLFGPPSTEMVLKWRRKDDNTDHDDSRNDELFDVATQITDRMKRRVSPIANPKERDEMEDNFVQKTDDGGETHCGESRQNTEINDTLVREINEDPIDSGSTPTTTIVPQSMLEYAEDTNAVTTTDNELSLDNGPLHESLSMPDLLFRQPPDDSMELATSYSSSDHLSSPSATFYESIRYLGPDGGVGQWVKKHSQTLAEKSNALLQKSTNRKPPPDPLEGVVHLEKPILLCQEIYNRIIGNHQTTLITKERALELLQQDIAHHIKENPDSESKDPFLIDEMMQALETSAPGGGHEESKECDNNDADVISEQEQPLVGYWMWENTLRTHKMKMHVAKNTDLALHVVMAIIVNQVRYERNAIALTI